jgi:hypothetical protein
MKLEDDERPGPNSAGQSGDDQGLSDEVAELTEEGQFFEAEIAEGMERPDVDDKEVRTHQVPEDDVPFEYDSDKDEPKE